MTARGRGVGGVAGPGGGRGLPDDHDRTLRLGRGLLRLLSLLVPRERRDEWRAEWGAELAHAVRRLGRDPGYTRGRILRRVLLSAPDAALLRIRRRAGAVARAARHHDRRHSRRNGTEAMFEDLLRDLRVSVRSLGKQRGFAALAVLTIGLGIGAATTIFGLVNGILLKPLTYSEPDRLVAVWPDRWYSGALFDLLEAEAESYEAVAAWGPRSFTGMDESGASRLWGARATGDFFRVLGTSAAAGRTFGRDDDAPESSGGVVLSHGYFLSRFGGDPSVIGRPLRLVNSELGDREVPIIGVMPPGFVFQPGYFSEVREPADFAVTAPFDREATRYRSSEYKTIGRLAAGVTPEQAEEELRALTNEWKERYGLDDDFGDDVAVVPLKQFIVGDARPTLLLLFGAVGLILLIATANVANLLLARALSQRREVAMRLALGATTGRVARQLLAESTLLGLLGSVVGLVVAIVGVNGVRSLLSPTTPRLEAVGVDTAVLAFCGLLALVTGWAVGLLPALQSRRADLRAALGGESRGGTGGRSTRRVQTGLLAAEIGLAVLLLASAGLLTKSFWRLNRLDPGFRPEGLVKLYVRPSSGRATSLEGAEQYFRLVDERLEAIPGVVTAAGITQAPVTGDGGVVSYYAADDAPEEGESARRVRWRAATPDYFEAAAIPIAAGRGFTDADTDGTEPVAILSRMAADELFPGRDPLGERVVTGFEPRQPVTVVGVVGDMRLLGPAEASLPMVYRPYRQIRTVFENFGFSGRELVLRTEVASAGLTGAVRDAVRELDRYALVSGYEPVTEAIAATLATHRTTLILLSLFAVGALGLGGIGIYGVTGYVVRQRRREIGVRVAVGASAGRVVALVLGSVLRVAVVGAALGVGAALALSGVLRGFVVEIAAIDPWVLAVAVGVALGLALLAGLVPARSAARTDPVEVLSGDA